MWGWVISLSVNILVPGLWAFILIEKECLVNAATAAVAYLFEYYYVIVMIQHMRTHMYSCSERLEQFLFFSRHKAPKGQLIVYNSRYRRAEVRVCTFRAPTYVVIDEVRCEKRTNV